MLGCARPYTEAFKGTRLGLAHLQVKLQELRLEQQVAGDEHEEEIVIKPVRAHTILWHNAHQRVRGRAILRSVSLAFDTPPPSAVSPPVDNPHIGACYDT